MVQLDLDLTLKLSGSGRVGRLNRDVIATAKFCRSIIEVLLHHLDLSGIPDKNFLDMINRVHSWHKHSKTAFVKFAKYATAWPMAKFLHNELPEKPIGFNCNPLIFSGHMYQLLKTRLTGGGHLSSSGFHIGVNIKNLSLWQSYLQGVKRGCAPVSNEYIDEAYSKHSNIIGKEPREQFSKYNFDKFDFQLLFSSYVYRFLKRFKCPTPQLLEATTSSALQIKRHEGGAREYIRSVIKYGLDSTLENNLTYIKSQKTIDNDELLQMYDSINDIGSLYGVTKPSLKSVISIAKNEQTDVQVIAISEPLKVRMITKGAPFRYWISRFFQKSMWDYLQNFPCFRLTGRKLETYMLNDIVHNANKIGFKFDSFVSGDYSAATDNLDINYTKICFEAFLSKTNYSQDLSDILRSVLYEQKLCYPDGSVIQQLNGQLMGSTLSFPILCLVNMVCYHLSLEEFLQKKVDLMDLPVLVNGDDILFPSCEGLYKIWLKKITNVGFLLSLGKNYIHPNVLTVNSECYTYDYKNNTFRKIQFLNCGLLTGQSKKGGSVSDRTLQPIYSIYNELIEKSPNPLRSHKRFLHYYKDAIKLQSCDGKHTYNLFIDQNLGGLGFKNPAIEDKINFTNFQRKLAAKCEIDLKQNIASRNLKFNRWKVVRQIDIPTKLVKKFTQNISLKLKTQPRNIKDKDYVNSTIDPGHLALSRFGDSDKLDESQIKIVLPKIDIRKFSGINTKIVGIKSRSRLLNWPFELVITDNKQTEFYDISL
jgi:hypothetical protein